MKQFIKRECKYLELDKLYISKKQEELESGE